MKAKIQESINIPFKVDDRGERLKDYDIRIGTWNLRILHKAGASAQLAKDWRLA